MRYQDEHDTHGEPISSAYVSHEPILLDPGGPSLTRQEFAEECDINALMLKYETTGVINHFNTATPQYLDVTDIPNLQESLHVMEEAKSAFMRLPAHVRKTFDNDAVQFVEFASDPKNVNQMREWGLAPPAPAPQTPLETPAKTADASKSKKGTSTASDGDVPF